MTMTMNQDRNSPLISNFHDLQKTKPWITKQLKRLESLDERCGKRASPGSDAAEGRQNPRVGNRWADQLLDESGIKKSENPQQLRKRKTVGVMKVMISSCVEVERRKEEEI